MGAAKVLAIASIALLVAAGFLGLAWYEDRGTESEQVGHERLGLSLSAPATQPVGPWEVTDVFTENSAGVPLQVAPEATVEARHTAGGVVEVLDERWAATLYIEHTGDGTRPWWTIEEPIPLDTSATDGTVTAHLPLAEVTARALALQNESGMPGRLDIRVTVTHRANVTVLSGPQASELTSTLRLDPREDHVVPQASEDSQVYTRTTEEGPPWLAAGLALAGVATAGGASTMNARAPAWQRARGVTAVEVEELDRPEGPVTDLQSLLELAREQGRSVLVDTRAGWALLQGPESLSAPLASEEPEPSSDPAPSEEPDPAGDPAPSEEPDPGNGPA